MQLIKHPTLWSKPFKVYKNPWKTLGLRPGCSSKSLEARYKKLCIKHHPDNGGDASVFKAISDAYEKIKSNKPNTKAYALATTIIHNAIVKYTVDSINLEKDHSKLHIAMRYSGNRLPTALAIDEVNKLLKSIKTNISSAEHHIKILKMHIKDYRKNNRKQLIAAYVLNSLKEELSKVNRHLRSQKDDLIIAEKVIKIIKQMKWPEQHTIINAYYGMSSTTNW